MPLIIPRASGIYKITCTANNRFYIGSASDVRERWYRHRRALQLGRHHSPHMQRAWDKHGEQSFTIEIIELVMPWSLLDREQYWLDTLNPFGKTGFNTNKFASGGKNPGFTQKPETRAKISASLKGHSVPIEVRDKIRQSAQGQKHTPETRAKISASTKGRKKSPSAAAKTGDAHAKNWIVTSPDGEEMLIRSLSKFCAENGLDQRNMWSIANGKQRQHRGWKCRYA